MHKKIKKAKKNIEDLDSFCNNKLATLSPDMKYG